MEKLRFRRKQGLGIHRFRIDGKQVKLGPGDTITCSREELGKGFFAQYDCLDGDLTALENVIARVPEIVPNDQFGWYDVVNPDYPERPLNEAPLRKRSAEKFLAELIGEKENGEG